MKKIINIKMLFAFFLLIGSMGMLAQQARASHLRGVTMSWSPTGVTRQVEFRFLYSERGGTRPVGSAYSVSINFGDGTTGTATGVVTSANVNDDYFVADLKVTKTYGTCGPFTAFYFSGARISSLRNGANGNIRMETIVTPCNGNRSPVVSLPPVVTVPVASSVQFSVPASDADGNRLRYRLATTTESAVAQPRTSAFYSIDANTGLVTFNTAGLSPAIAAGNLFTSQIIVEDLDANGNVISKVPVDFIIKFVANVGSAPTLTINPAGPLTVSANQPVSFTVTGNDVDANSRVTLSASGMPTGATMSPAIGAQLTPPVTSTFNWTPTTAQAGPTGNTFVINFSATDDTNRQDLKSITINVLPVGAPTAASQSITASGGVPQNITLSATDPNALAMTFSITGSPANGTVSLTGSPSCSVTGGVSTCTQNATYTANAGYSGNDLFTFRASNGVQNSNAANVNITVSSNAAPTVNCPSNPAAIQYAAPNGATVPVTFQVADANADALTVQWKVDGSIVQTDNVATSNQPSNVTFSGQYAVGTHTVQVIVSDGRAAAVSSCTVQFSVAKANQTISFGALPGKTYGDADFAVSANASSNLTVAFAASGNCTISGSMVHITGAGSCTITASQTGDANFDAAPDVAQSFAIAKASPLINWSNPTDITYGTALSGTQLNAAASFQNSPLAGSFDYTPLAGAVLNAGSAQTLSVSFTPTDSANFNSASATVSINVLRAALTIEADDKSRTYGGAPVPFTISSNGFVNGDTLASLGGTLAFNFADESNKPAGSYTITPSGLTSNNYDITFENGTLTVSRAALIVTADNAGKTYGSVNPSFTAQYAGFVPGETAGVLGGALVFNTTADQTSPVGNYPVTPAGLTSDNYEISFVDGTLEITRAALTVTTDAASKTYGDAPVSFTAGYSGFVNGDDASDLGGALAFDFTDTVNTAAGSYQVAPSGLTSGNYNIAYAAGTFTVSAAAITVAADNQTRAYGAANPLLTGTLTGVRNGDNITASYNSAADPTSAVGDYPITPALSDPDGKLGNYTVSSTDGTLTVTQAALTVIADSLTRTYGAANPALTGTVTGVLNGDGITASYATPAIPSSVIGNYPITVSLNDPNNRLGNYSVSTTDGVLTVEKAALSVTADSLSRVYGTANPTLTGTINGVQNGENITASYSTTADSLSNAGTYPIVPTLDGATLSNYEITVNNGTLTVTKAAQTIVWSNPADIIYGTTLGAAQLNAVVSGVTGGSAAGALSYSPAAGTLLNAGNGQALTVNAAATNNYEAASKTVYLNVLKATPVVNWSNPAAILVGVPLGAAQLNATASHPADGGPLSGGSLTGSFGYTPAAATVLPVGNNLLSVVFTPADSANYNTASKSVTQRVNYKICAQYDQSKAHKSGSTIPIKLQICSAEGVNLSSAGIVVNSIGTRKISSTPWGEVEDAGNANPDNNFRFTDGKYMYNLQTKGLTSGVYQLGFIVGNDPTIYTVEFQVK